MNNLKCGLSIECLCTLQQTQCMRLLILTAIMREKKCSTVLLYSLMPLPKAAHLTWTASVTSGNSNSDHIRGTGLCCLSKNNRTWQCLTLTLPTPTAKPINLTVTLWLSLMGWSEQQEVACCCCLPLNRARTGIRCAYTANSGSGSVHTHSAVYTTHTGKLQYIHISQITHMLVLIFLDSSVCVFNPYCV